MNLKTWIAGIAVAASLTTAPAANAQMDAPFPNYAQDNMNAIMSSHIASLSIKNIVEGKSRRGSYVVGRPGSSAGRRSTSARGTRTVNRPATTSFMPSAAVTKKTAQQFVAQVRTKAPADADRVANDLKRNDITKIWRGIVASYGLKTNDVADAITAWWMLQWVIANNKTDVTQAQARGAREQIRTQLMAQPSFQSATNAQKQAFAQSLYIRFVYQHAAFLHAIKPENADFKQQLSDAARSQFQRESGADLQRLNLTQTGFRN